MIRGVIFDLDGVLVSTDEYHYQAWKLIADKEGILFNRHINDRLRGVSRLESLEIILKSSSKQYSDKEKTELCECKNSHYGILLNKLNPQAVLLGAVEIIQQLRSMDIKTAIASSSKNARLILELVGLNRKMDVIVDGKDITHSKPHPEVFLLAAKRMALSTDECLVVEDAVAGVQAALRAGMSVLGISTNEGLKDANYTISSLSQITACELLQIGLSKKE